MKLPPGWALPVRMALIVALEEAFGFIVADDEISGELFASVGSLTAFVAAKCAA